MNDMIWLADKLINKFTSVCVKLKSLLLIDNILLHNIVHQYMSIKRKFKLINDHEIIKAFFIL